MSEIPDFVRAALDQYDACMRDPAKHLETTGRAPFEEGALVMAAIRRALEEARMEGVITGAGMLGRFVEGKA